MVGGVGPWRGPGLTNSRLHVWLGEPSRRRRVWGWGRRETVCSGDTSALPLALILQHRRVTPIRDTLKLAGTGLVAGWWI